MYKRIFYPLNFYPSPTDTVFIANTFNDLLYGNVKNSLLLKIKPYLFPLSSMTDELWDKEFRGLGITEFTRDSFKYGCETLEFDNNSTDFSSIVKFINQLIKHHFDIYGLIPMGLAIDATNLKIYDR